MIVDLIEPGADAPCVLIVSASELNQRGGALLREAALGAVIRIDDLRRGVTVGWLTAEPPASVRAIDGTLPEPGEAIDHLLPEVPDAAQ